MSKITNEQLKKLDDAYINIMMSAELGWEVTIGGNGYNSHEAAGVISGVYDLLGLTEPEYSAEQLKQFVIDCGEDPDDYL